MSAQRAVPFYLLDRRATLAMTMGTNLTIANQVITFAHPVIARADERTCKWAGVRPWQSRLIKSRANGAAHIYTPHSNKNPAEWRGFLFNPNGYIIRGIPATKRNLNIPLGHSNLAVRLGHTRHHGTGAGRCAVQCGYLRLGRIG